MSLLQWSDAQLEAAKIDKERVLKLVAKLNECSAELSLMNMTLCGNGQGFLIHDSRPAISENGQPDFLAIVAYVGPGFEGVEW